MAIAPVDHVPLAVTAPFQPPEAIHVVALPEFQLRAEVAPLTTVVGDADSVTVGAAEVTTTSADCEAEPAGPVQVNV